jgi:hypothetical protein
LYKFQKYKQVSIENALSNAASLYHQNSTRKQKNKSTIKTTTTMKKQIKKLSFSTEKIVSLSKTQLQDAQGGRPSNSGQSYNCLASNQTYYPRCQY